MTEQTPHTLIIGDKDLKRFDYALADALMFIAGFNAARDAATGDRYPGDLRGLRDLRDAVQRALP